MTMTVSLEQWKTGYLCSVFKSLWDVLKDNWISAFMMDDCLHVSVL